MRVFQHKEWEYSLEKFAELEKKKSWVARFRLEYSFMLTNHTRLSERLNVFLKNILAFFNLALHILKQQARPIKIKTLPNLIILVANNDVYIQNLKPLVGHLQKKEQDFVVLCPSKHYREIKAKLDEDAELIAYEQLTTDDTYAGRFFRLFYAIIKSVIDRLWFVFQPVRHSWTFSSAFARYALTDHFFRMQLRKLFDRPVNLLSTNDHWMWESLYYTVARDSAAKSMIVQHGVLGDISYPIWAHKFYVWGSFDEAKLINEYGAQPNEVKVIGSPYFDTVYNEAQRKKTQASQFDQPYITFLSQPFTNTHFMEPGYYEDIVQWFYELEGLAQTLKKELTVKLHPADKAEYYLQRPSSATICTDPLQQVLNKSCLVITIDSTAMFEAVMFGVPAVQTILEKQARKIDFWSSGICALAQSGDQLHEIVYDLLSNPVKFEARVAMANQGLNQYYFGLGRSLERFDKVLF